MSVEGKLSDLQLKVYDKIRLAGWAGKTVDEIEVELGATHQSVSARVNELAHWKPEPLIERRGITRKTRTGRGAGVYVVSGMPEAAAREDAVRGK